MDGQIADVQSMELDFRECESWFIEGSINEREECCCFHGKHFSRSSMSFILLYPIWFLIWPFLMFFQHFHIRKSRHHLCWWLDGHQRQYFLFFCPSLVDYVDLNIKICQDGRDKYASLQLLLNLTFDIYRAYLEY